MTPKVATKAARDPENCFEAKNVHWTKLTNEKEGTAKQKFGVAFETIIKISTGKCCERSKQNFSLICLFFFNKAC